MTCIVGLIQNNKVYIGADSAGVISGEGTVLLNARKDLKVFKANKFLFGCAGSFRMIDILKYSFNLKYDKSIPIERFMRTVFVDYLQNLFEDKGFGGNDEDGITGGIFLVGYENKLFTVDYDYSIGENLEDYAAIGSGSVSALGSLHTTNNLELTPKEKILFALEAAAYHEGTVCKPFTILST